MYLPHQGRSVLLKPRAEQLAEPRIAVIIPSQVLLCSSQRRCLVTPLFGQFFHYAREVGQCLALKDGHLGLGIEKLLKLLFVNLLGKGPFKTYILSLVYQLMYAAYTCFSTLTDLAD